MLRPTFPGGVPYPPRPGEPGRYALAPYAPGGPVVASGPSGQSATYRDGATGQVFVRQPPADGGRVGDRRGGAGSALPQMRAVPGPFYPAQLSDPREREVQVLSSSVSSGVPLGLVPHGGENASKRARMEPHRPLTIDTREQKEPGYHPQVEAISPTPDDRTAERDDVRSTKDDLLQKISKVDREIAKAESQIAKLKKKQHDLEDAANRPTSDSANEDEKPGQSIAQSVYSENRKKAGQSHASLEKFTAKNDLPLYNQPSDTEVYSTNKKNYTVFKKKLVEYFKKRSEEREQRDRYLTVTYSKLTSQWTKKVDRLEGKKSRKEREGRAREQYEKIFPELRKQREDKERDARLGTRGVVKSEADFDDVLERLHEQEMEDKKMHSYAVIPPPVLPPDERRRKFTNNNGLMRDPMQVHKEKEYVNMWTEAEKETFVEKFLQSPKNFGMISQYLDRKTVSDCVQYYYLSKKAVNYKQLLRKTRQRPRQRRTQQPQGEVLAPNLSGVVTRRKVEEALKGGQGEAQEGSSKGNSRSNTPGPVHIKTEENGESEKDLGKKKGGRGAEKKGDAQGGQESSDEEDANQAVKSGPHPCVVCKAVVETSRAAGKTQALQLGVKEEDLATGEARVCNTCWCKTLKKKHSAVCPVPTCTSNKVRSRGKLRHLPKKWGDLTKEARDTVMADLGLPEKTKHVCAACFTRITRRISQLECEPGTSKGKKEEEVNWAEDAIEKAKGSLRQYGTNWTKMAEAVRDKTEDQCKKFFYNQRKRLQLDKVVQEYKRANRPGGDDKPSLTSDEESGSSTSSGEEDANNLPMEVDQAEDKGKELKPPAVPPPQEQRVEVEAKKAEDYNSADTMSADETGEMQGGPAKKPAKGMKTVEGLVEAVIKNSLPVQGATTSVASVAVTTATQSLNTLLRDAGPSPRDLKNYVRDTVRDGPHAPPAQRPKEVGGVPVQRPEQELQPGAGIALGQVRPSSDGVIDFSMTRPERSSPAPAPGGVPLEHGGGYHGAYNKLPREPMPESAGKEPPAAHGGQKPKTSHKDILMMSMNDPAVFFRPDSKSPAPYTDPRSSVHSPGPHMVIRGDPRNGIPSLSIPPKPALHPTNKPGSATPSHPPSLTVTPSRPSGSLMEGTPKVRPPHGTPAQASPRYDPAHHPAQGGSIIKGQPVYRPQDAAPRRQHPTHAQDSRASSHPSMEVYKAQQARGSPYPSPYPPSRPASHEQPGLPRSSRSIIEGDYSIAQSMQKHPRDPPSSGFPRTIDPHRRDPVPTGDPRLDPRADPRGFYPAGHRFGAPVVGRGDPRAEVRGDPRAELPGARGDPRAEIPRARGDPRDRELVRNPMTHELTDAMGRPVDPRVVDPRAGDPRSVPMLDPRVPRGAPQLYPGYPDPRAVPRPRSPPRQPHPLTSAASPSGSISTGQPKHSREANPYHRQPEVSIVPTKSLPGGARPEGYAPNLADLANLAETQQRLPSHPSREGPGRPPQGAMMDPRGHFERPKNQDALGPPRGGSSREGTQQRIIEQAHRDQTINKQQEMISRISQMSEQDQKAYLENLKNSSRNQPDHMSAANLIDLIITHQINRNTVVPGLPPGHPAAGPPGSQNPRRSPQAPDGKESPNKMPSASPSMKNLPEGLEVSGPSGSGVRTSPGTMGEHIENMISKEVGRGGTGSPYPGTSSAEHEHWKRRGYPQEGYRPPSQPRPPSNSHAGLSTDERVIQRVVQNASPAGSAGRPDKPPSRSMHEAISPPTSVPYPPHTMYPGQAPIEPAMAKFFASARRKEEAERAAVSRSGAGVSHFDDYVKYKITEVMKNEKSGSGGAGPSEQKPPISHAHSMGPPHKRPLESEARGSPSEHPPGPESPNKRYKRDEASASNDMPDSPESGDMVIDESARPDSAHSQKTNSPAPAPPAEGGHYPPGFRGAPAQPPRSSPAPTGARPPPQPSQARYEPLSDDD